VIGSIISKTLYIMKSRNKFMYKIGKNMPQSIPKIWK